MSRIPGVLLRHTVSVEPYQGATATGEQYGPPGTVRCLLSQETQLVRAPDGNEVVSSANYITTPDHTPPPLSRVTLPDGRVTAVIRVAVVDGAGLPVPSNSQVFLT